MKTRERIGSVGLRRIWKQRAASADPEAQVVFAVQQMLEATGKTRYLTPEESQLLIEAAENEARALLSSSEEPEAKISEST
jgi:hypothetical protein